MPGCPVHASAEVDGQDALISCWDGPSPALDSGRLGGTETLLSQQPQGWPMARAHA